MKAVSGPCSLFAIYIYCIYVCALGLFFPSFFPLFFSFFLFKWKPKGMRDFQPSFFCFMVVRELTLVVQIQGLHSCLLRVSSQEADKSYTLNRALKQATALGLFKLISTY